MSYVYIRVRNSPAGRVKPIKMKCFDKKQEDCRSYDLNDDFSNVCMLFKSFLRKLRVKYLYYDMRNFKGVYKTYHYPYVQAYITDKNAPPYDNGYKTREEVAKYLCKYFWSYEAEKQFIKNAKMYKELTDDGSPEEKETSMNYLIELTLYSAGIINLAKERSKYLETGETDFHTVIYDLFCKYLENPNFIDEQMEATPTASILKTSLRIHDALSTWCFGDMFRY